LIADGYHYDHLSKEEGLQRLQYWFSNVYHTPFDDLSQPIDFSATMQHVQIIFEITRRLAGHENDIQWKSGLPYKSARLRSIAERR
jgi:hypothetical protein